MSEQLTKELSTIAHGFPGKIGLYLRDLKTGKTVAINADELFPMASTYKVPIMMQLFRDRDAGLLSFEDKVVLKQAQITQGHGLLRFFKPDLTLSYNDLALLMITISDNAATDVILEKVTPQRVNETLKKFKIAPMSVEHSTKELLAYMNKHPNYRPLDLKGDATTPRAMGMLLEMMIKNEIASAQSCQEMKFILEQQLLNSRFPRKLSLGSLKIAHKTGTTKWATNDVGFIKMPERPEVVFCIYTLKNDPQTPTHQAEEIIGEMAEKIVKTLHEEEDVAL